MKGRDLQWRSSSLKALPVSNQLFLMDLGPGLDQPLLTTWQAASKYFYDINRNDSNLIVEIETRFSRT